MSLTLSAASLAVTLVLVELVLRWGILPDSFQPQTTELVTAGESRLFRPDFRKPRREPGPKEDQFRIVVVGDSFAWGDGVHAEDAFPDRLEIRLNAVSRGDRFEVVNWSRPGWNTVRQYRSLKDRLDWLDPDLLILSVVLNDAEPTEPEELEELRTGIVTREPGPGLSASLYGHSRLYQWAWDRLENTRRRRELTAYYHSLFHGEHWQAFGRAVRSLHKATRSRSIPMILVVFPIFDCQLDDSYPYLELHAKAGEVGESLDVPVLDLTEEYQAVDARRLAVIPFTNAHPNELAHRMAADAIVDYLARGRLVPPLDYVPRHRRRDPRLEP